MTAHGTETADREVGSSGTDGSLRDLLEATAPLGDEAGEEVIGRVDRTSLSLVGGATLLGLAAVTRRRRVAVLEAIAGGVLLAMGLRRWTRDAGRGEGVAEEATTVDEADVDKDVSDEAHAATVEHDAIQEQRADVADPAEDPEVSASGVEPGDDVSYTEEGDEPRSKPDLEADAEDPRRTTGDDVEVDVSDASIADEPGEATGPDPEQSQPAETEGTEPEPTAEEETESVDADLDDAEDDAAGPEENA